MNPVALAGFLAVVVGLLVLDLCLVRKDAEAIGVRGAMKLTAFWVGIALLFNVLVYFLYDRHWLGLGAGEGAPGGRAAATLFLTAYLVEESLSLDNILVIALVLAHFRIPAHLRHRVLFWGILGAIVLRGVMIGAGLALLQRFAWVVYVFGGLLFLSAVRLLRHKPEQHDPERGWMVRAVRRLYPVTQELDGQRFFTRKGGRRAATPMFLALVVVEASDVLFAVDSIPAVFAVTTDPFLVFTSNICAILGLRSMFFALSAVMDRFRYVQQGLVLVLLFVGAKLMLSHHLHVPPLVSLGVIGGTILTSALLSVWRPLPPE